MTTVDSARLGWLIGGANLITAAIVVGLSIPLALGRIKRNGMYGVRTAKALESDELWDRINRYGGRRFLFWSVPVAASGLAAFTLPDVIVPLMLLGPALYLLPCLESRRYGSRL